MKICVLKDANGVYEVNYSGTRQSLGLHVNIYLGPIFGPAETQPVVKEEKGRWAIDKISIIFAPLGKAGYKTIYL